MPQKQYTVQAPDGRTITLQGPDGASESEVIAQAQKLMSAAPPQRGMAVDAQTMPGRATDAPALTRLLGQGAEMLDPRQFATMLSSPVQTLKGIKDAPMQMFNKAVNAPTMSEKIGYGTAAMVPFVGPMAANLGEQGASGDVAGAIGGALAMIAPTARGVAKSRPVTAARAVASEYIPQRLISSLIKPDKASFDFGANPTKAVLEANVVAPSMGALEKTLKTKMSATEAMLQSSVSAAGNATRDIASAIGKGFDKAITQARRDANDSLAKRLEQIRDIRIKEVRQRHGGNTTLNAKEHLAEKRLLKDEVKFNPKDTIEETINDAKMAAYREIDANLDALVPVSKELNQTYAGLIEADLALKKRLMIRNRSDILPGTVMSIAKKGPETALKTGAAQVLRKR